VSPVRQLPRTVDVLARDEGTIWLLTPVSDAGRTRLREHVEAEATWLGDALVVEHRYAWPLIEALSREGFRLQIRRARS
jgi:hypothetical protein